MKLTDERAAYQKYLKKLRDIASEQHTKMADAEELRKNRSVEIAKSMKEDGASIDFIAKHTGLSKEEIENI